MNNNKEIKYKVKQTYLESATLQNNFTPLSLKTLSEMYNIPKSTIGVWVKDLKDELATKRVNAIINADSEILSNKQVTFILKNKMVSDKSLTALHRYVESILQRKAEITDAQAKILNNIYTTTTSVYERLDTTQDKPNVNTIINSIPLVIEQDNDDIIEAEVEGNR